MARRGSELRQRVNSQEGGGGGEAQTQNRGAICLTDTQGARLIGIYYEFKIEFDFDSERQDRQGRHVCVCLV